MATADNVISFDDHTNDLHLSQWAWFLKSQAEDLEKLAFAHEDHLNAGYRRQALQHLSQMESLIGAARRRQTAEGNDD